MKQSYGEIEFPKVSFCNLNPMKFSKMLENEKLFQIINETATKNQVELTEFGLYLEVFFFLILNMYSKCIWRPKLEMNLARQNV